FKEIEKIMEKVKQKEKNTMKKVAKLISKTIQHDGIIHLFGCGHSHILTEEVYYRAGGLVPIHPILHEPLMLHEGALKSSELERKNDYAETFMKNQDIKKKDLVFIISTSGRNPVPIDAAIIAKKTGAYVVGLTSIDYSSSEPSKHKSKKHLYNVVDYVIDNHAPVGDALLNHENVQVNFSPSSTVIGSIILNSMFAEAIVDMAKNNFNPPILMSGNVSGSDDYNKQIIHKYKERIKL